jgi:hypothetical protein
MVHTGGSGRIFPNSKKEIGVWYSACRESDMTRGEGGWGWGENAMGQNNEEEDTVMSIAKGRLWEIYIKGVEQRGGGAERRKGVCLGNNGGRWWWKSKEEKRRPIRRYNTWQQTATLGAWIGVTRTCLLLPSTSLTAQPHPALKADASLTAK